MAKILDPIPPILSILGDWAILLGSFGGLGFLLSCRDPDASDASEFG